MFGDAKASINLQISYEIISVHHPRNVLTLSGKASKKWMKGRQPTIRLSNLRKICPSMEKTSTR
jgi:DNA-binding Xre family transcriptional regulator